MVLLDLLHIQRDSFFKLLKFGINKEFSQLNINLESTRLQIIPFENLPSINSLEKATQKEKKVLKTFSFSKLTKYGSTYILDKNNLSQVNFSKTPKTSNLLKLSLPTNFESIKNLRKIPVAKLLSKVGKKQSNRIPLLSTLSCQKNCFRLIAPKLTPRQAILYQKSWSCKIIVKVLLTVYERKRPTLVTHKLDKGKNKNSQKREHSLFLFLGELPLMTKRGHFIIHGSPRVILSQLTRTPGIYFTQKNNEIQADCVPEQGPWLCIYKDINSNESSKTNTQFPLSVVFTNDAAKIRPSDPKHKHFLESKSKNTTTSKKEDLISYTKTTTFALDFNQETVTDNTTSSFGPEIGNDSPFLTEGMTVKNLENPIFLKFDRVPFVEQPVIHKKIQTAGAYYCYTKQFSSMPFSLIFSTFRIFEFYSQFTDQTLLLIKLKTLEKIRKFKETITILLSFTWKKRIRRKLHKLYTKKCYISTQQFEKTKALFRLKKKLVLGALGRKSFNEKLGISDCFNKNSKDLKDSKDSKSWQNLDIQNSKSFSKDLSFLASPIKTEKTDFSVVFEKTPPKFYGFPIDQNHQDHQNRQNHLGILFPSNTKIMCESLLSQDLALIIHNLNSYKIKNLDDIDDLNNQRIRTSSDQIQQQIRVGLFRFKKMFAKLVTSGESSQTITDFLNSSLREFFGSNPLSQFLDQTNPLAEITHKRRISKLGLGGIQRESATLKVRTIHFTYFGRICPIETPEGLNAGLVNSLTCLSRVDQRGQLVTPLSLIVEGQKQEDFFYYSNKEDTPISTTDTSLLKFQRLPNQLIYTKKKSQFKQLEAKKVKLRVKSDLQTISLATALIPFLSYDDANRALMGSNMQRQAVPLIIPERPIIRTGMESLVINESGHSLQSPLGGFISYTSAQHIALLCSTLNKRFLVN